MIDGDMDARKKTILFVGVAIDGVGQQLRPYAGEVQQSVALGRGAVACDGLALAADPNQELQQIALHLHDARSIGAVALKGSKAVLFFKAANLGNAWQLRVSARLRPPAEHTERAPVRGQAFDIEDGEVMLSKRPLYGGQRQIRKVFMVNRIE